MRSCCLLIATLVALLAPTAQAQVRELSGVVRDVTSGQVVPAVRVGVAGHAVMACTNERGEYRLIVPAGPVELVARLDGYREARRTVASDDKSVDLKLAQDLPPGSPLVYVDGIRVSPNLPVTTPRPEQPEPLIYLDGIRISPCGS